VTHAPIDAGTGLCGTLRALRRGPWRLRLAPGAEAVAESVLQRSSLPGPVAQVMRDDERSFVGVLEVGGVAVVAKRPRAQDRRAWIRWTTLWRPGHAFRALSAMWQLRRAGVPVPRPLLALERRRGGMVRESWLLYEFAPGRHCTEAEFPQIIGALRRLHALGWVHGDPQWRNFVSDGERVCLLDATPIRTPFGRVSQAYDFVLLCNSDRRFAPLVPLAPGDPALHLARAYDRWVHAWRRVKRWVRSGGR
jgi:hypothetical protein